MIFFSSIKHLKTLQKYAPMVRALSNEVTSKIVITVEEIVRDGNDTIRQVYKLALRPLN